MRENKLNWFYKKLNKNCDLFLYINFDSFGFYIGLTREYYGKWDYSFVIHILFFGFRICFKTNKSSIGSQF